MQESHRLAGELAQGVFEIPSHKRNLGVYELCGQPRVVEQLFDRLGPTFVPLGCFSLRGVSVLSLAVPDGNGSKESNPHTFLRLASSLAKKLRNRRLSP
jgi:hypothetical protein